VRHAVLLAALSSVACVPTFDDNLPLITSPLVLAVQAEPAEVVPGQSVTLTGLVGSPDPAAADAPLVWGLCTARKPLTELGPVSPTCIQAPSAAPDSITDLGRGASVTATIPTDACRLFGPSLPPPMNGEPAGRPVDPDPTGGFYQPIGATLPSTGVTTLGAVRIFCPPSGLDLEQARDFNTNYRNNQSPAFDSIGLLNGAGELTPIPAEGESPLRVAPGEALRIQARWAACPTSSTCGDGVCSALEDRNSCADDCSVYRGCSGAESYAFFNLDSRELETQHESIRVSWFSTAGRYETAVTGRSESEYELTDTANIWTAPTTPGQARLWLVMRDARGGQSFSSFLVSVE
jgi:hypothetical protein